MKFAGKYIAGDWGTSNLRLFLCEGNRLLDRCDGPGVSTVAAASPEPDFAATLARLTAAWVDRHGALPIHLAGMIGSTLGWRLAPYVPCPADATVIAASTIQFSADGLDVTIVPGLVCTNPRGASDVMRGEETQIVGALRRFETLAQGSHIIVLPGTHSKWASIDNGRVICFQSSLSGELYSLLRDHSTLSRGPALRDGINEAAFLRGVERTLEQRSTPLTHLLFETRSRQLIDGLTRSDALAFLSGLIIGQDVLGGLEIFAPHLQRGACVPVIGAGGLVDLYRLALMQHGVKSMHIDASDATVSGLQSLAAAAEVPHVGRA